MSNVLNKRTMINTTLIYKRRKRVKEHFQTSDVVRTSTLVVEQQRRAAQPTNDCWFSTVQL